MTQQATAQAAIGAIFGAIATTASTAGNLVGTIGDGASMLNKHVNLQSWKQDQRIIDAKDTYQRELAEQSAMRRVQAKAEIDKFLSNNAETTELFNQHVASLMAKFNPPK